MELHKAIKEIVASKGADMVKDPQIINYLLDYQAFKEKPATKLILRAVIDSGYAESVLALVFNPVGWETKFKQYQHEFIDSCGYKEEIAAYVFDSIAYGVGLNTGNAEPEIHSHINVDSFFDIPEVGQPQQPAAPSNQNPPKADPTDLYTIALSFYNEGKYQQAKGFIEKTISLTPSSSVPSNHLRLLGDIYRMIGQYEDAVKAYNECFSQKASELRCSMDELRDNLKQHKIKGFENIMFCYFFCLYCAKRMNDAQWQQFVKGEARFGLMEAIQYCADNGINPIDDHFDIYFVDKELLRTGDFLYEDGTFSHENSTTKKAIARIALGPTSDYEQSHGWNHGYIIYLKPIGRGNRIEISGYLYPLKWSTKNIDLPFPHSHYTVDDLNHWDEINIVESEQFIKIDDYDDYPIFKIINTMNGLYPIPITNTSGWILPSIHHFKRIIRIDKSLIPYNREILLGTYYWTSSQATATRAVCYACSGFSSFILEIKSKEGYVLPIAAF